VGGHGAASYGAASPKGGKDGRKKEEPAGEQAPKKRKREG